MRATGVTTKWMRSRQPVARRRAPTKTGHGERNPVGARLARDRGDGRVDCFATNGRAQARSYRSGSAGYGIGAVLEHGVVIALYANGPGEVAAEIVAATQAVEHEGEIAFRCPAQVAYGA